VPDFWIVNLGRRLIGGNTPGATGAEAGAANVAATFVFAVIGKEHVGFVLMPPEQVTPDQPEKKLAKVGVAVRVTGVPLGKHFVQIVPQLMPDGELTVPDPVPDF
jgi:hypothetical protein